MERRNNINGNNKIEDRADGGKKLVGYAAVYYKPEDRGTQYQMWDDSVERIAPGAFDRALAQKQDVRGLFNHDSASLLGRTIAGTMRLSSDSVGLRYEIDLPDTQTGKDVAESVRRGDLSGSSFAFSTVGVQWTRDTEAKMDVRTILDVDLFDVGPVTYPAYDATSTGLRSLEQVDLRAERDAWKKSLQPSSVAVRMRLLELDSTI